MLTKIKDVKHYLNLVFISCDGLLVIKCYEPFAASCECLVILCPVIDGFLAALHVKLDHPSHHQMKLVLQCYFFTLDLDKALDWSSQCCHLCFSLKKIYFSLVEQSTSDPPDDFGISSTAACLLDDERRKSIRYGLL